MFDFRCLRFDVNAEKTEIGKRRVQESNKEKGGIRKQDSRMRKRI
jgi:hypothetical protein